MHRRYVSDMRFFVDSKSVEQIFEYSLLLGCYFSLWMRVYLVSFERSVMLQFPLEVMYFVMSRYTGCLVSHRC